MGRLSIAGYSSMIAPPRSWGSPIFFSFAAVDRINFAAFAMLFVGAMSGGFHALNGAVIARETEPAYMGRVMSLTLLAFAGFSLTALPLGILADRFGERAVLFGMGSGVVLLALWMAAIVARDAQIKPVD